MPAGYCQTTVDASKTGPSTQTRFIEGPSGVVISTAQPAQPPTAQAMNSCDEALLDLHKAGTITLDEAMSHADSRSNLEAKINFGG